MENTRYVRYKSMIMRIPLCPWCNAEMKWLLDETDFDNHVDTCRQCKKKIVIEGSIVLEIVAEKYDYPKPVLKSVPLEESN